MATHLDRAFVALALLVSSAACSAISYEGPSEDAAPIAETTPSVADSASPSVAESTPSTADESTTTASADEDDSTLRPQLQVTMRQHFFEGEIVGGTFSPANADGFQRVHRATTERFDGYSYITERLDSPEGFVCYENLLADGGEWQRINGPTESEPDFLPLSDPRQPNFVSWLGRPVTIERFAESVVRFPEAVGGRQTRELDKGELARLGGLVFDGLRLSEYQSATVTMKADAEGTVSLIAIDALDDPADDQPGSESAEFSDPARLLRFQLAYEWLPADTVRVTPATPIGDAPGCVLPG